MQDVFRSITSIFKDLDAGPQVNEAVMFAGWRRAAGPQLCAHALPIRFAYRRLTVAVSGIRWKQQMEALGPQMVFRLNGAFGASVLNFIEFVVDEDAVRKSRAPSVTEKTLHAQPPAVIVDAAVAIRDSKLRREFLEAAAACIERPRRKTLRD